MDFVCDGKNLCHFNVKTFVQQKCNYNNDLPFAHKNCVCLNVSNNAETQNKNCKFTMSCNTSISTSRWVIIVAIVVFALYFSQHSFFYYT